MHLARKTDAGYVFSADSGLGQDSLDRLDRGVPPVFGTLLGPQWMSHLNVFVRGGHAGGDASFGVHQQGTRAASSNVNSKPILHGFTCLLACRRR